MCAIILVELRVTHSPVKTLIYDLEVSPVLGWAYDKYDSTLIEIEHDYFLLSFSYKWLGEKEVYTHALPDYKTYKKDKMDDSELCKEFYKVRNQADIVLGHNMKRFDERKANTRLVMNGFTAPPQAQVIDTLALARQRFYFTGNSLADLTKHLKIPYEKMHMDKDIWLKCIRGDKEAWEYEKLYNARDIDVTEAVYNKLRSYATSHPNMNAFEDGEMACHACKSLDLSPKGWRVLMSGARKRRYLCKSCGIMTCERWTTNTTVTRS